MIDTNLSFGYISKRGVTSDLLILMSRLGLRSVKIKEWEKKEKRREREW